MTRTRSEWKGGVAANAAEMDELDEAWWLSLTLAERLSLVAELSTAFDWSQLDDDDGVPRRFLGADCGVRG